MYGYEIYIEVCATRPPNKTHTYGSFRTIATRSIDDEPWTAERIADETAGLIRRGIIKTVEDDREKRRSEID